MRSNQLVSLSREINERENTLAMLRDRTAEHGNAYVREVILQGQSLSQVKKMLPHGDWEMWLKNCPLISSRTAVRYMSVYRSAENLTQATSLRAAVALCTEENRAQGKHLQPNRYPPGLEFTEKTARLEATLLKLEPQ